MDLGLCCGGGVGWYWKEIIYNISTLYAFFRLFYIFCVHNNTRSRHRQMR